LVLFYICTLTHLLKYSCIIMFGLTIQVRFKNLKTSHPDKTGNQEDYFFSISLTPISMKSIICHDSEHWVVMTNGRSNFFIILFGVAFLVELRYGRQHGFSKPNCISLHTVCNNLYINRFWLQSTATQFLT
jgi:hypothetical protein